jgi:hypothetical protein
MGIAMAVQRTFLLIADICGYTRFMKFHRTSLAHAQDIIAKLLEAVIDAAGGRLTLAKLEGDAAFFYVPFGDRGEPDLSFVAEGIARIYHAFHERIEDFKADELCPCDACRQAVNLKIKFAGHLGEAAIHKVKRSTELAGVDVIVVHRMLKNDVPVVEYLLVTEPVHKRLDGELRGRAAVLSMDLDELGVFETYFVDISQFVGLSAPKPRRSLPSRIAALLRMAVRTFPYSIGLRRACADFANVETAKRPR